MLIDNIIAKEVDMYVICCEIAAEHGSDEALYKKLAHVLFYHILEMRETRKGVSHG